MRIIGLTGSFGAGKGEKVRGAFARGCQIFLEVMKRNIDNLNSVCKTPAPDEILVVRSNKAYL